MAWLFLLAPTLTGCAGKGEADTLLVWSNNPDTAFFIERYNFLMDKEVDFEFVPNLVEALTQQRVHADLVVGSFVNTPTATARMSTIDFDGSGVPTGTVWLPLAFSLPTIVYDAGGPLASAGPALTFAEIGERLYGAETVDTIEHPLFLYSYPEDASWVFLRSLGLTVTGDNNGDPSIDEAVLRRGLSEIRRRQERYHGSIRREQEYRDQYLSEPWARLLEKERIAALYLPSDRLLGWDFIAERRWDFSVLTREDGRYFALDNVVYVGIPKETELSREARALVIWLADPDVQLDLIAQKLVQRIDSFGLFGGFSTNQRVTTVMIEEIYPGLAAHFFPPETVVLPGEHPRYWDEALERVVYPALDSPEPVDLRQELSRWYRQRGD